jgi:putative AlgH/UPF0301 family transcriptional regulator
MLRADATADDGSGGGLIAVSTSQPLPSGPPDDVHARLGAAEVRRWAALAAAPQTPDSGTGAVRVRHYDGGPLERSTPIAVAHVPASADASAAARFKSLAGTGVRRVPPAWVYGPFGAVADVVREAAAPAATTVNVVWGYGGWGGTQVLAEIGRGGWGLVSVPAYLALRPDPTLEISWELDLEWNRIVPIAKLPPPSEYSRAGRRRR